jgi:hypothetical protein
MMVAQLELRAKHLDSAESALAAALQLRPRLRPAVVGVQRELRHWKKVGVNHNLDASPPSSLFGGSHPLRSSSLSQVKQRGARNSGLDAGVSWLFEQMGFPLPPPSSSSSFMMGFENEAGSGGGDPWFLFRGVEVCLMAADLVEDVLAQFIETLAVSQM